MNITITITSTAAIDRDEDEILFAIHQASGLINDFELSELDGAELFDSTGEGCGQISVEDDDESTTEEGLGRKHSACERAEAAARRLWKELKRVEWAATSPWPRDGSVNPACPSCKAADGGSKNYIHAPGCKLEAALLETAHLLSAAGGEG